MVVRPDHFVFSQQRRSPVGPGMGPDGPIKGISCPRLGKGDFRNDREWVITNVQAEVGIQLDQNFRGSYDDSSDLIQILEFHHGHWRNAKVCNLYRRQRLLRTSRKISFGQPNATWVSM